jgi:hypothetical protein
MKLELKHLAAYLPYGLKFDGKRNGWVNFDGSVKNLCPMDLDGRWEVIKPILRPLLDLTRQNVADMIEYSDFDSVYFNSNPSDLIFINTEDKTYLSDILKNTEFLLKNHFDIYGLIDAGLAIDINTINK